eukprot:680737-Rhodomonas_salina.1
MFDRRTKLLQHDGLGAQNLRVNPGPPQAAPSTKTALSGAITVVSVQPEYRCAVVEPVPGPTGSMSRE